MRISDWSSDVCSSDLALECLQDLSDRAVPHVDRTAVDAELEMPDAAHVLEGRRVPPLALAEQPLLLHQRGDVGGRIAQRQHEARIGEQLQQVFHARDVVVGLRRSEEHTSELQSLMRTSYAVF